MEDIYVYVLMYGDYNGGAEAEAVYRTQHEATLALEERTKATRDRNYWLTGLTLEGTNV